MTKELLIKNDLDLTSVLQYINDNFSKPEPESIIVKFKEDIEESCLLESLKQIWDFESNSKHTVDILIKNLSYDMRKEALRLALKTENLHNPVFLSNVFCLIKGYNTFADEYFEHEQVFLNDEVEFLDIFDDLEEEIANVTHKLAEYYVSMLKTCNLVEAVENNPNAVKIEELYVYLFSVMDVLVLARVLSSVKDNSIWETKKIVLGSLNYLESIAEKFIFTNKMLNIIDLNILQKKSEQ